MLVRRVSLCFLLSACLVTPAALAHNPSAAAAGTLRIAVAGVSDNRGQVCIELFTQQETALFPDRTPLLKQRIAATAGTVTFVFNHLPSGRYAALVFHDENSNGLLDKNWLGIPSEQWGVTGKRPFGRSPRYAESAFSFDSTHQQITIHME